MKERNWIQSLKGYHEFLGWYTDTDTLRADYRHMTQDEAKARLKDNLEFILGTNGHRELYGIEREFMKLLNMKEEE